jgi:taurine dioxygenase
MTPDALTLHDLPGSIGTEALGVDAAAASSFDIAWTARDIDALRAAFDRRHLLLLHGEPISGEAQLGFVARFGPLVPERRLWGYVSNVREDGIVREGALLFHSDFAFTRAPTLAISLHALQVPAHDAPTRFANAVRAAQVLPADLRARLRGRRVLNVYDFHRPNDRPMRVDEVDPRSPRYAHPAVGVHPRTGADVVMANEMHTDHIVGLTRAESDALLTELFAVLYHDDNVYEHHWRVGDLVLWDNVALHHGRPDFPVDEPRTLQRVTLGAYTPSELVPNLAELLAARR